MSSELIAKPVTALETVQRGVCARTGPCDPLDGLAYAIAFMAAVYGSRFQPHPGCAMAWHALLGEYTAEEVCDAVLRWARSMDVNAAGDRYSHFPPDATDLLEVITARRKVSR